MTSPLILDVHQHSGPWPFCGETGGIALNQRLMARRGISAAVISSARAVVQDIGAGNAELADEIKASTNLFAYVTLNPNIRAVSEQEIARYRTNPRFVGYKIHPAYAGCSIGDARVTALLDILAPLAKPVLLHTWGAGEVQALQRQAERHPELPLIMAHAGADAWRLAIQAAKSCPNLYLDFTCSTPYAGAIQRALDNVGSSQLVFGSDATLFDPLVMLAQFERLQMGASDRALVMSGNAQRIFNIKLGCGGWI
ncbi:MAG: amidohydrolase family protein [Chloroflexi bacterium]|nr:amidohydrolase family protein [Chloroflexota bacterium]